MGNIINPLTLNPYCTESLPCAEGLGGAAAERNKRFFPKITARLVFKIKCSFFSPFLVNGYILSCKCQKCKKIILIYIYILSSYVIAKIKFITFYGRYSFDDTHSMHHSTLSLLTGSENNASR